MTPIYLPTLSNKFSKLSVCTQGMSFNNLPSKDFTADVPTDNSTPPPLGLSY